MPKEKKQVKNEFYNKKARFEYEISDSFEAGIVLTGDEIKSIRSGHIDMTGSYVKILSGEVVWLGANFTEAIDRQRTRKLLLHKDQIKKIVGKVEEKGMALIPIKLYLTRGKAKLEVGLGKGKKEFDKRETIKKRDIEREIAGRVKESIRR